MLAKDVVLYAAGNLAVLLDLDSQEQTYIRSLGGGGIGAIAVSLDDGALHRVLLAPFNSVRHNVHVASN